MGCFLATQLITTMSLELHCLVCIASYISSPSLFTCNVDCTCVHTCTHACVKLIMWLVKAKTKYSQLTCHMVIANGPVGQVVAGPLS